MVAPQAASSAFQLSRLFAVVRFTGIGVSDVWRNEARRHPRASPVSVQLTDTSNGSLRRIDRTALNLEIAVRVEKHMSIEGGRTCSRDSKCCWLILKANLHEKHILEVLENHVEHRVY